MSARRHEYTPYELSLARHYFGRIPTNEDWYPSLTGGFVYVYTAHLTNGQYRVAVWGGDDFGYEKDVTTKSEQEALVRRLPCPMTAAALDAQGYGRA